MDPKLFILATWIIALIAFFSMPSFLAVVRKHKNVGSVIVLNFSLPFVFYLVYSVSYAFDVSYFVMLSVDTVLYLCLLAWSLASGAVFKIKEVDIEL